MPPLALYRNCSTFSYFATVSWSRDLLVGSRRNVHHHLYSPLITAFVIDAIAFVVITNVVIDTARIPDSRAPAHLSIPARASANCAPSFCFSIYDHWRTTDERRKFPRLGMMSLSRTTLPCAFVRTRFSSCTFYPFLASYHPTASDNTITLLTTFVLATEQTRTAAFLSYHLCESLTRAPASISQKRHHKRCWPIA